MEGNGNGSNGSVVSLLGRVVEELGHVREELGGVHKELVEIRQEHVHLREEQASTRVELIEMRRDMNRGFGQVSGRLDNVLAITGRHHDDHEQRIQTLEQHVLGKKSG